MGLWLFGLTGNVASGKSTVAARFREQGLAVVDADQVARQVVAPGQPGLDEVVAEFGPEILHEGRLDRNRLGEIVFADEARRARLNAMLHPLIGAATRRICRDLEQQGVLLACYEAALLVENGLQDAFRPLVVTTVSAKLQLERLIARDQLPPEEARRRVQAQLPQQTKIDVADHVIDTSGSLAQTLVRADDVLAAVRAARQARS